MASNPPERQAVMEIINEWEEIGEARGVAIGEARGVAIGEAKIVLRIIQRNCGAISEQLRSRILALPASTLEALADAALDFNSLSQLEAWFSQLA